MTEERAGERVIKKIGSSHVIWFPESNRWMEFREPAWFIYKKLETGENEQSLTGQLAKRYGLPQKEALRFLREVTSGINLSVRATMGPELGREDETEYTGLDNLTDPAKNRHYVTRHYLINKKHITISYGTALLEHYIHRPLAHLETGGEPANSLRIRLFQEMTGGVVAGDGVTGSNVPGGEATGSNLTGISQATLQDNRAGTGKAGRQDNISDRRAPGKSSEDEGARSYYLQFEAPAGDSSRSFRFDESGLLKHRLYTAITNHIYGIPEEGWMSFIHASAVTNGREAIILSSASGSGKSTMAALLQLPAEKSSRSNQGDLFFMSDDFVPVAAESREAYPFPAAITVKKGSFDVIAPYYDPDRDADAGYRGSAGSQVRYLCPRFPEKNPYGARPVKNIIFIKHTPGVPFRFRKLDTLSALAAFHEEAWVSQNPGHAQSFIDWFVTVECLRLEYDDSRKAVQAIRALFE